MIRLLIVMTLSHRIAAYLGVLKPDQITHFSFPLPENAFIFRDPSPETFFLTFFLKLGRAKKADISFSFQVNIKL